MILLGGVTGDGPLDDVRAAARSAGLPHVFADLGRPEQFSLLGTGPEATLGVAGRTVRRADLTGIYLRAPTGRLRAWADAAPSTVRVVNRTAAAASNASKPFQVPAITAAGFRVPESLLTTDAAAARDFVTRHTRVVVKSISGERSIVRLVRTDEDLAAVAWCPTQFQRYVPGAEHRVHVVGDRVLAHRVYSDDVDYRYGSAALRPAQLPDAVAARCRSLTADLGLHLAGIDLRQAPDGTWYCFEVNTSPAFSCYGDRRIGEALARFLAGDA